MNKEAVRLIKNKEFGSAYMALFYFLNPSADLNVDGRLSVLELDAIFKKPNP